jgi:hypothetical protein
VEVKQQYLIKISNIFAALENVAANLDIKRNWRRTTQRTSGKGSLGI